jgi:hypothetical protein
MTRALQVGCIEEEAHITTMISHVYLSALDVIHISARCLTFARYCYLAQWITAQDEWSRSIAPLY